MKWTFVWLLSICACISEKSFSQTAQSDQYWQKAEKLAMEGKYEQSLPLYEKAFDLIRNTDPFRAANLCNDMSSAHFGDGRYEVSIGYCYQGLSFLKKQRNAPDSLYFKLYTSLATMHNALLRSDSSYYYFQAADDILLKNPAVEKQIPTYVLQHYLHWGRSFLLLHRYHQSIAYFTKAETLSESYQLTFELSYIQSSLAEVYDLLGDHRKALTYRLATLRHHFADKKELQGLYTGLGYTYERLNLLDSALLCQQTSWKLHLTQPKNTAYYRKQHIELLFLMGSLYRKKGQLTEAQRYLTSAEQYRAKEFSKDILIKSLILIENGLLASSRQQLSLAEQHFQDAYKAVSLPSASANRVSVDLVYPQAGLRALLLYASTLFKHYNTSGNISDLQASYHAFSDLVKLKRSLYLDAAEDTEERHFLSYESYDVFKEAIPAAYALYQKKPSAGILQEIFNWFEEANATYLYEVIKDKKIRLQQLTPEILEKEQQLIQKRALLARSENSSSDSVKKELDDLRIQWYKLRQDIRTKYPSAYSSSNQSIQFARVQQQLGNESAFVSYKWFDGLMYVFVVTSDTTRLLSWQVNKTLLQSHLSALQSQFNVNPGFGNYKGAQAAIGCYKMLIEPLHKWLALKKRLVIARDWQFNFLPFEVLENGSKSGHFLTKDFAISYTYSASFFWQHPFKGTGKAGKSLTIAPFVKEQILPDTTWSAVSQLADILKIGGENLWGNRATKQRLLQSKLDYQILHFATHAYSADDNPNDSYIQLFPGIDSRLYLNEINALPLHGTRLVVLSACSAGNGRNLRGEGNISLAHAIAQAGCPSVITTSWEANDEVINYLSIRLHDYLDQGFALDHALQQARMDFFQDNEFKQYAHPYYWANLTLIGNNEPINTAPVISGISSLLVMIFAIGMLAAALFVRSKKKRHLIS